VRNKKLEKTHAKEKQLHAQDNIYVVWQFTYIHRVAGISLLLGKNTKCDHTVFPSLKKLQPTNPNHQSPLKKKSNIIRIGSGRVVNRIKHN